jgi:hypothetical protein
MTLKNDLVLVNLTETIYCIFANLKLNLRIPIKQSRFLLICCSVVWILYISSQVIHFHNMFRVCLLFALCLIEILYNKFYVTFAWCFSSIFDALLYIHNT